MSDNNTGNKNFLNKKRDKYWFSITKGEFYTVISSVKLNKTNVLLIVFGLLLLSGLIGFLIMAYTPLKQYVPGYGQFYERKKILELRLQADQLEFEIDKSQNFIENLVKLLKDDIDTNTLAKLENQYNYDSIDISSISLEDSLFRLSVEENEAFTIYEKPTQSLETIKGLVIRPVKGIISSEFDPEIGHYGVDVVTKKQTPIKAVLDGKVMLASYTIKDGYVIIVSHENGLISVYKHGQELLRKVGSEVKSGEIIARLGNTGEDSSGPHLHFELWYKNIPINPEEYIDFE